jgi:hypothetical protein
MIVSGDPQDIETPTIIYTFNRISSVGDIKDAVGDALGDDIAKFQAVKINASFHILLEHHAHNKGHGSTKVPGTDDYVSYALSRDAANQSKLIPQLIQQTYIDSDCSAYTDYLHREIQGVIDAKTHQSSSTKYVAITGITLKVFRMRYTGVADLIHGFEDLYNSSNKAIYTCASCQNCCVLEAIFIARKPDEYRSLKGNPRQILARMLGQYYNLFGKVMTLPFAGVDAASTLLMAAKKYNFSFSLFKRDPKFVDDDTTPPIVFQDAITPPDPPTPPKHFNLLCCVNENK